MPDPTPTNWAAGRYEAVAERIAVIATEVVAAVDARRPVPDSDLVDLACGTGSAALAAAAAGARVTGVDLTPELIAIAAQRPLGETVTWVVSDAAHTGLPDATFDAAVSNMGIIFVEPSALVAEVSRLLRRDGIFAFSSWIRDDVGSPFFTPVIETLGAPPASSYVPDQWGDPAVVQARLAEDFDDIQIQTGMHTWQFDSLPSAMTFLERESPMHVDLLNRVEPARRDQLMTAFEKAFGAHADDSGRVSFEGPYLVATARRR